MGKYYTTRGTVRAYYLATIICIASFMQGYDAGVAGGVLSMGSFQHDYQYTKKQRTSINALSVGLQNAGAFVATFIAFPLTRRFGRRWAIMASAVIFSIGASVEVANTHSLAAWYIGRFIAGVGQGGCSIVVPIYSAEMAPKAIRSKIGSMYQWFFTIGICVSYWVDYGAVRGIKGSNPAQWQVPVGIRLVSSGVLFLGILTLKESVRWLVKEDRFDEAWQSLLWIRGDSITQQSAGVVEEFDTIKQSIIEERLIHHGLKKRDIFLEPSNRKRALLAVLIFLFQQGTGSTALAIFAPQFFTLVIGEGDRTLLVTGLFGGIKVIACTLFVLFIADRFGRRTMFMSGGLCMGFCLLAVSLLLAFRHESTEPNHAVSSYSQAVIALIFLNVAAYNSSWGTLPFVYIPEIFPTRTREVGVGIALAAHWAFSVTFSIATPYMIRDWGWRTFLFYAIIDFLMSAFSYFFITETKGKSLEEIDSLFAVKTLDTTVKHFEHT